MDGVTNVHFWLPPGREEASLSHPSEKRRNRRKKVRNRVKKRLKQGITLPLRPVS